MIEGSGSNSRFLDGMKFGLGFSVPFVVLYALVGSLVTVAQRAVSKSVLADTAGKTYGPGAGLQILHHESDQPRGNLIVRGRLRNGGKDTWDYVRLQVDLLDESGRFVGLCSGRCAGPFHPGQERNFSVDCEGSDKDPLPAFKRYTIEVVDASYKSPREAGHDGA
jgi:hypothetical protein